MSVHILVGGELEERWDREIVLNARHEVLRPVCKEVSGQIAGGGCFGFEDADTFLVCSVDGRTLFVDYVAGSGLRGRLNWLKGLARAADCRQVQAYACSPARGRLFRRLGFVADVPPATNMWVLEV